MASAESRTPTERQLRDALEQAQVRVAAAKRAIAAVAETGEATRQKALAAQSTRTASLEDDQERVAADLTRTRELLAQGRAEPPVQLFFGARRAAMAVGFFGGLFLWNRVMPGARFTNGLLFVGLTGLASLVVWTWRRL